MQVSATGGLLLRCVQCLLLIYGNKYGLYIDNLYMHAMVRYGRVKVVLCCGVVRCGRIKVVLMLWSCAVWES